MAGSDGIGMEGIVAQTFGEGAFTFTQFLHQSGHPFHEAVGSIVNYAIAVGLVLFALQAAKYAYDGVRGDSGWKEKLFTSFVPVILIVVMLKTVYSTVVLQVIGGIPETIANELGEKSMVQFAGKFLELFDTYSGSKEKVGSFINVSAANGAIVQVIALITYLAMAGLTMIVPLAQKYFFMLAAYIGPFCFVGLFFDYTKEVFKKWLGAILAIAWIPVWHAIVMHMYVNGGLLDDAIKGAELDNAFAVLVASVINSALLISSPVISIYLFGAVGAGIEKAGIGSMLSDAGKMGAKAALPGIGAIAGAARKAGYSTDENGKSVKKDGAGAAVARGVHSLARNVVKGSNKGGTHGNLASRLSDGTSNPMKPALPSASVPGVGSNTSGRRADSGTAAASSNSQKSNMPDSGSVPDSTGKGK